MNHFSCIICIICLLSCSVGVSAAFQLLVLPLSMSSLSSFDIPVRQQQSRLRHIFDTPLPPSPPIQTTSCSNYLSIENNIDLSSIKRDRARTLAKKASKFILHLRKHLNTKQVVAMSLMLSWLIGGTVVNGGTKTGLGITRSTITKSAVHPTVEKVAFSQFLDYCEHGGQRQRSKSTAHFDKEELDP